MPDTMSLKRITLLLRKGFPNIRNTTFIWLLILFVLLVLRAESFHSPQENENFISQIFQAALFIGGSVFASQAFHELHNKQDNFSWLMLPASILEKFTAQLVLSTFLYAVFLLAGIYIVTFVADILGRFLYAHDAGVFRPWDPWVWVLMGKYFFYHSMFFLGAAYFRKHVFVKTTAVALLLVIIIFSVAIFCFIG